VSDWLLGLNSNMSTFDFQFEIFWSAWCQECRHFPVELKQKLKKELKIDGFFDYPTRTIWLVFVDILNDILILNDIHDDIFNMTSFEEWMFTRALNAVARARCCLYCIEGCRGELGNVKSKCAHCAEFCNEKSTFVDQGNDDDCEHCQEYCGGCFRYRYRCADCKSQFIGCADTSGA
jgi:hypothetical protein